MFNREFEIRPRGGFMLDGNIIKAKNIEEAMLQAVQPTITGAHNHKTYMVVCKTADWILSSWNAKLKTRTVMTSIGRGYQEINPKQNITWKRLACAKALEAICQSSEETPNLKFANFEEQLTEYKRKHQKMEYGVENFIKESGEKSILASAECQKECAIAETATITGETTKANKAIKMAKEKLGMATMHAKSSHPLNDTKFNLADKAVTKAQKQFDKTIKKIQSKAISTNQNQGLAIG